MTEPIQQIAKEFPQIHWDFIGCLPEGAKSLSEHNFTPLFQVTPLSYKIYTGRNPQNQIMPYFHIFPITAVKQITSCVSMVLVRLPEFIPTFRLILPRYNPAKPGLAETPAILV